MFALRFQQLNIFILEKSVQFIGKINEKSKKKTIWKIQHQKQIHDIECILSFNSGKKRVYHNKLKIVDIIDNKTKHINVVVSIGEQNMIFTVNQNNQEVKLERKYHQNKVNAFLAFKNIYSQPLENVFEKSFGS